MGRRPKEPDYGLPALTFAEAARVLGVEEGAFMAWTMKTARPSAAQWTQWTADRDQKSWRPIPEKLIRLYLSDQRAAASVPPLVDRRRGERRKTARG